MDLTDKPLDFSSIADMYVQKVSLETAEQTVLLQREIRVMYSLNRRTADWWTDVLKSLKKISEFINLFCKKSPQKISTLALVIIDKLQGAHNKFLDAARTKNVDSTYQLNKTSGKLLQQSGKFYTYALIAEKSGQTLFRDLYIKAGEVLAQESRHRHRLFYLADMESQLANASAMRRRSQEQNAMGNERAIKIFDALSHYSKILAAIAIINCERNTQPLPALVFSSSGMEQVYKYFDNQSHEIAYSVAQLALWKAEVMLCDLHAHVELLNPNAIIPNGMVDYGYDVQKLVSSVVGLHPDQENYLNDWFHSVPAEQILQILRMGGRYLPDYVQLLQDQGFLQACVDESRTFINAQQSHIKPFYRRVWKHINQQALRWEAVTSDAINSFRQTAAERSDTEWTVLHTACCDLNEWMQIIATLDDTYDCLACYIQQLECVRQIRPTKIVEVIARAWRGAQLCMDQLLLDIEASVSKNGAFKDVIHSEHVQNKHKLSCLRALAYAQIAQELHLNTAGLSGEALMTQQEGDMVCTNALNNVMAQIAVLAEKSVQHLDKNSATADPEQPTRDLILATIRDQFDHVVASRINGKYHEVDKVRAELWRTIYRIQVQLMAHKLINAPEVLWFFESTLSLLVKLATSYNPTRNSKTVEYVLLSADYYLRSFGRSQRERFQFCDLCQSYGLAAEAQDLLLELTCNDYDPTEDVSITLARMRVDRHLCVAKTYLEPVNGPGKRTFLDKESILERSLLQTVRDLLSYKVVYCEISDNNLKLSAVVWENLLGKEVFIRFLPHMPSLSEQLPDYDVVLSEQLLGQIDEYVVCCLEHFFCETGSFYAKIKEDVHSEKWWKRAQTALGLVRTHIYLHCFASFPVEMIVHSRSLYDTIKQCAVTYDSRKILHVSCVTVAELAIENFGRTVAGGLDMAAQEQHVILCHYCVLFLLAAMQEDATFIDLALAAVDSQKRLVQGNSFPFALKCDVAAADARVFAYTAGKAGHIEAAQLFETSCNLFVEAKEQHATNGGARGREIYEEGKKLVAEAKAKVDNTNRIAKG